MARHPRTSEAAGPRGADSAPSGATRSGVFSPEVESVKPMFRDRLAPLASRGLLAIGVQVILREGGFAQDAAGRHCGCLSCARRCVVSADRRC